MKNFCENSKLAAVKENEFRNIREDIFSKIAREYAKFNHILRDSKNKFS